MSIVPPKTDNCDKVLGDLAETVYQVERASQGKSYKPMGQEEIVEPLGKWVGKIRGSKQERGR